MSLCVMSMVISLVILRLLTMSIRRGLMSTRLSRMRRQTISVTMVSLLPLSKSCKNIQRHIQLRITIMQSSLLQTLMVTLAMTVINIMSRLMFGASSIVSITRLSQRLNGLQLTVGSLPPNWQQCSQKLTISWHRVLCQ